MNDTQHDETIFKPTPAKVSERAPLDAQLFKAVMRQVAGTVTVISTASEHGLHGMTATAMCSVCADPPSVLIVVNRTARTHPHIDKKKAFTINILGDHQLDVAELFASKSDAQFEKIDHVRMDDDCPVITGAAGFLHCAVDQQFDVGTHTIFVGHILNAGTNEATTLVYQDAKYGHVASGADGS